VALAVTVMAGGGLAIPSRVANRMIPSWWVNARSQVPCGGKSDCAPNECCVRPMLASNSYCMVYKELGESCDASALLLDMKNEVYFENCPCLSHLTCANFRVSSLCIPPDSENSEHRFALMPKPVEFQRDGMPGGNSLVV